MTVLWRYTKAQAGWSWLLPPLVAGVMLLDLLTGRPAEQGLQKAEDLAVLFEYFLPLAAAIYLAGVPVFDREEGAAEVLLTCPAWPSVRLLLAALPRVAVWAATAGLAAWIIDRWYLGDQVEHMGALLWPTALALSGAAVAGAALTRHQAGGLLAAILWWLIDAVIPPGKIHTYGYLFRLSRPVPGLTPDQVLTSVWAVGVVLWCLALWLSHRRERWIR